MPHQSVEAKRAYQKEWRQRNRDRVYANRKAWAAANPEKVKAYRESPRYKTLCKKYDAKTYRNRSPLVRKKVLLLSARQRAQAKNLEFSLTVDNIVWPEFCPVLGIKLNYGAPTKGRDSWDSPSIDRRDSRRGYTPDNVAVMSWRANRIKADATLEETQKLYEYLIKTRSN